MEMNKADKVMLLDLASFIQWSVKHDHDFKSTLVNVAHDCKGILMNCECFLPRTNGYSEILKAEG